MAFQLLTADQRQVTIAGNSYFFIPFQLFDVIESSVLLDCASSPSCVENLSVPRSLVHPPLPFPPSVGHVLREYATQITSKALIVMQISLSRRVCISSSRRLSCRAARLSASFDLRPQIRRFVLAKSLAITLTDQLCNQNFSPFFRL